jgi:hypothetical protein
MKAGGSNIVSSGPNRIKEEGKASVVGLSSKLNAVNASKAVGI